MIVCRSRAEIEKLRRVNQLVAQVLAELRKMAAPGVTTAEIDRVAEERVRGAGAEPGDPVALPDAAPDPVKPEKKVELF